MNILNYDSPFIQEVRKLVDFILLGMLWMLASVPIFTFGAATTAMYYTAENRIHRDAGKIWTTFWSSFRKEFRQATVLWLISLAVILPLGLNTLLLWRVQLNGLVFAVLLVTVLLGTGWLMLWYGYLSKIEDSIKILLINTFRIALVSFPKLIVLELILVASVAGAVLAFFYAFPVMALVPGIYAGLTGMMLRNIFKPYLPQPEAPESEDTSHT